MEQLKKFDVIIIGGSYSGLAAGMALGRAIRQVLVVDSGLPCNRQTPYSHNFLGQDGKSPHEIASLAKMQVENYPTVEYFNGLAKSVTRLEDGFDLRTDSGEIFHAGKLIFATGIRDILPAIDGLAACWGISVLHCPYCHGYEYRDQKTGILANGENGFEFSRIISNWTKELFLFTNGPSTLEAAQTEKLESHRIKIIEKQIERIEHREGRLEKILFRDGSESSIKALYAAIPFEQHCSIPESLGCEITVEGYIKIDQFHKTAVDGVFSCGDAVTRMRTLANAVGMGTTTGMIVNKEIILERF